MTHAPVDPRTLDVERAATAPEEWLLGFTRALREAGVPVTTDRAQLFLDAVAALDLGDRASTRRAGRATLCTSPEHLERFEEVFAAWFVADAPSARGIEEPRRRPRVVQALLSTEESPGDGGADDDHALRVAASEREVLRHRDIAQLGAAEQERLASLFAALDPVLPSRRSYRRRPWRRGDVDATATLRRTMRQLGEPMEIVRRRRSVRPRRVVLLVDVSGSMAPYADALLRVAHRCVHGGRGPAGGPRGRGRLEVEAFSLGTRLTRLTPALQHTDAERALVAAGSAVPDWSGGTRLGEGVKAFLDRWGQRGMARGAVVVLFSDGWERGDAALLGEQMARLQRLAHHVVWANPHKGAVGYQPLQQGMAAALPHVDSFVAGHSLASLEKVLAVVARA